jgi:adenylate kinase
VLLLGAPGVGKGTQAQLLKQRLGACHLSTGDVFRAAGSRKACEQTPAMAAALDYMRRGDLVPDSTVWEMVRERSGCLHCQGGFVLDGSRVRWGRPRPSASWWKRRIPRQVPR